MTVSNRRETLPRNDDDQLKAFKKAVRKLGCEDNEERFKDALRTVAKAKPLEKDKKSR